MKKWKIFATFWGVAAFFAPPLHATTPLDDAVALWNFDGLNDANGANSQLTAVGDVQLNVPLNEQETAESRLRGGDGKIAKFSIGSYLNAGQGAQNELSFGKNALSIYLRLRLPANLTDCPIFSKRGSQKFAFNIFAYREYLGLELDTTQNKSRLVGRAAFDEMRSPPNALAAWHDVVVRMNEGKLEFFVDGRCFDEDFVLGDLVQNDQPVLIGAQAYGDQQIDARFSGEIDTIAVWNRTLSEEEILWLAGGKEKADLRTRLDRGNGESLQYWTPPNGYFVGDTFPFAHDGVFHAAFLLDKRHHGSKNGFGAHQWIQATSTDLVHWTHQPFLVPIEYQKEGSICTGSVLVHDGKFYAFYGNRWSKGFSQNTTNFPDDGLLTCSVSEDGIHFQKRLKPLFPDPEGYGHGTRDPIVFKDPQSGVFHLYATDSFLGRGCWLHAVSRDLENWDIQDPVFTDRQGQPECPDWFEWNGLYYVIAGHGNGFYRVSKNPTGPWEIPAKPNILMPGSAKVPKTAPWKNDRRIITGWVGLENRWAGALVFHELVRRQDGTLGEKFVPEMIPQTLDPVVSEKQINANEKTWSKLPADYRLQMELEFNPARRDALTEWKLLLDDELTLTISPFQRSATLGNVKLERVDFTSGKLSIDLIVKENITDLCLNDDRAVTLYREKKAKHSISFKKDDSQGIRIEKMIVSPLK